jgi:hypothetical protein
MTIGDFLYQASFWHWFGLFMIALAISPSWKVVKKK